MRHQLQQRVDELSREIRAYPTPIARCDLQLPALLEERAQLLAQLESLNEHGSCSPAATWNNDGGFDAA